MWKLIRYLAAGMLPLTLVLGACGADTASTTGAPQSDQWTPFGARVDDLILAYGPAWAESSLDQHAVHIASGIDVLRAEGLCDWPVSWAAFAEDKEGWRTAAFLPGADPDRPVVVRVSGGSGSLVSLTTSSGVAVSRWPGIDPASLWHGELTGEMLDAGADLWARWARTICGEPAS